PRSRAGRWRTARTTGRRAARPRPATAAACRRRRSRCRRNARPGKGPTAACQARRAAGLSFRRLPRLRAAHHEPRVPRSLAALDHVLEDLLVLERVHGAEEALVPIRDELPGLDHPLERLDDELLAVFDEVEHLVAEHEVAGIDPDVGVR